MRQLDERQNSQGIESLKGDNRCVYCLAINYNVKRECVHMSKNLLERITKLITVKRVMIFLIIVYLLSLIPLCMISKYNYPSADDYTNGASTYHLWNETHSVPQILIDATGRTVDEYGGWRGCYTSSYLSALPPCIFGQEWTFLTPLISLLLLSLSVVFLVDQIVGRMLKADRRIGICISMVILFISVQSLPSVARCEFLYWYSGACNYAYIHAFALIFYGLLIAVATHQGKRRKVDIVLACVMAFVTAGGNQMSSLNGTIVVLSVIALIIWCKKWKEYKVLLIPLLCYLASFVLSMAAPGDWVRMQYTTSMGPVKAVLVSLYYTFNYAVDEWTTWPVMLLEVMLVPFFWMLAKNITIRFRYPVLVIAFGYGMVSAMMTPPLFAVSNIEAGRIQGLVYWMYILVLTLCVGYAVIWGYQKLHGVRKKDEICIPSEEAFSFHGSCWILSCMAVFAFAAGLTIMPTPYYFTMTSAVTDLVNGNAQGFALEMQERVELYESSDTGVVEVYELEHQPELLFFSDLKPDSSDWENKAVAKYFDLEEVIWRNSSAMTE